MGFVIPTLWQESDTASVRAEMEVDDVEGGRAVPEPPLQEWDRDVSHPFL